MTQGSQEKSSQAAKPSSICRRLDDPKGPLWGFGYSYFADHLGRRELPRPALLDYSGLWGAGSEYAYEVLNLINGRRSNLEVRNAVAAIYGPVAVKMIEGYIETLEAIGVLSCGESA